MIEETILKIKKALDVTDRIIAVFLVGCMISITPLYASAAIVKAHKQVQQVAMLSPMSAAVLKHALTPVKDVKLKPVSMRLPPVLPIRRK